VLGGLMRLCKYDTRKQVKSQKEKGKKQVFTAKGTENHEACSERSRTGKK